MRPVAAAQGLERKVGVIIQLLFHGQSLCSRLLAFIYFREIVLELAIASGHLFLDKELLEMLLLERRELLLLDLADELQGFRYQVLLLHAVRDILADALQLLVGL